MNIRTVVDITVRMWYNHPMKETVKPLLKFIDSFDKPRRFIEVSSIEFDHGAILLKYCGKVICDTSTVGNVVNPYQCNDIAFLRHAFDIVRYAIDVACDRKCSKLKLRKMVEEIGDVEQYPITPGKWHVTFEMNGWKELIGESSGFICHGSYEKNTGYLYWMFSKCPEIYKALLGLNMNPGNFLSTSSIKRLVYDMAVDYNKYLEEQK